MQYSTLEVIIAPQIHWVGATDGGQATAMRIGYLGSILLVLGAGCAQSTPSARVTPAPSDTLQGPSVAAPDPGSAEELARRATDPTASPMSFGFINAFTMSYEDQSDGTPVDGTGYELKFQPVLPFSAWGQPNILRMTLPYSVSGPGNRGLGDVTVFDLLVFQLPWGRLGAGAVASLASRTSEGPQFKAGPALGVMVPATKQLNVGLFTQNLFASGVAITQIQPIAAYQLGEGWSLSLGDIQWPYDWEAGQWVAMPVGLQIGKVLRVSRQPMRFSVNPQYDFKPLPGAGRFSTLATIQLLVPEK